MTFEPGTLTLQKLQQNAHVLHLGEGTELLISYATPVAIKIGDGFYVTESKHSQSTHRHIYKWMHEHGRMIPDAAPITQQRLDSSLTHTVEVSSR